MSSIQSLLNLVKFREAFKEKVFPSIPNIYNPVHTVNNTYC